MQQGNVLKSQLEGSTGGYLDHLCDFQGKANVTNLADASVTGSNSSYFLSRDETGYVILGAAIGTAQAAGNGFNVDLPTPERGLWYKFVLRAPSIANDNGAQITITSTSNGDTAADLIIGTVRGHGDDQGANVVAVADTITFVKAKATAGDNCEIWCDGTNWYADIIYDADASVTLA